MTESIALASTAFTALFVGLLIGWLATRGRSNALGQAAAAAKAEMQVDLATLTERARSLSMALELERERHEALKQTADMRRTELDSASNEIAKLTERASRVPTLEGEISTAHEALKARDAELREISTANGQNAERASQLSLQLAEAQAAATELEQRLGATTSALQLANEAKAGFEQHALRVPGLEAQLEEVRGLLAATKGELTELRTRTDEERQQATEKLQLLLDAKEALTNQFKSLAADILEEKSKRFTEQNQTNLGQLLDPLRTQLTEFKGKVEAVYHQEGKDRMALAEQVRQLAALNQTLSQDAKNLTLALKGQAKTQGNWGELILERVLEASGLRKGLEYKVQDSQTREDGSRAQPDVIIELPEDRKLVVDAKVSLVAYDRYTSANTDEERAAALREHLNSVRTHIKGLSDKQYHALYGLQSLDFVLAFVPVEPAFMLAVTNDNELFMDAWQRNVLLVSPSTLLFVVRTVAHLWRQEAQSRNAQDIAKRGAEMYDKLCGFVGDIQKVGDRLRLAREAFDDAQSKLSTGKGNLIRQAEMLRDLGVKPSKSLPATLVQNATADNDVVIKELATFAEPETKADLVDSGNKASA